MPKVVPSQNDADPSEISSSIATLVSNHTLVNSPASDLDKWNLHQLTEVAYELKLIREETTAQIRIARNFRNLIHPGVSVRKNIACNRGTALSALAGMEHAINDLSRKPP